MTEKKLTAKLSDGTEWEVVERCDTPFDIKTNTILDGYDRMLLKPLKPSPPKEVFVTMHKETGSLVSVRKAILNTDDLYKCYSFHRYVLAEETLKEKAIRLGKEAFNGENILFKKLEKPQPREWWDVRYKKNGKAYCSYYVETDASEFVVRENRVRPMESQLEVAHVREVLP
jgi:hypothetical protein